MQPYQTGARPLQRVDTGPLEAADAASRRAFGNDALARNQARDVWIAPPLQDISQDVRFAVRMLVKDRRFTIAAIVALALGIGVNNSVFAIFNASAIKSAACFCLSISPL